MEISPIFASVAPRIVSPSTGCVLPATEVIKDALSYARGTRIAIVGEVGSGKSTALAHLAASFPGHRDLLLIDDERLLDADHGSAKVVVFAKTRGCGILEKASTVEASTVENGALADEVEFWSLAPWGLDEALEYLMALHRPACASVFPKLQAHDLRDLMPRRPILWTRLLDLLATDPSVETVQQGIDRIIENLASNVLVLERLTLLANATMLNDRDRAMDALLAISKLELMPNSMRMISEEAILGALAVRAFTENLMQAESPAFLKSKLNSRSLEMLARRVSVNDALTRRLMELVEKDVHCQAVAASILCRAIPAWRPTSAVSYLRNGNFEGVSWDYLQVARCAELSDENQQNISGASFYGASLIDANLSGCLAANTSFVEANLSSANLTRLRARNATFSGSNLNCATLQKAILWNATFTGAHCLYADFSQAQLVDTDLRNGNFERANFEKSELRGAKLEGADFTSARLVAISGRGLDFRHSKLRDACFHQAQLRDCNFESQVLPMADFSNANLTGALLSGTLIENGNFSEACLIGARLGNIDWEGSDLRGADLSGATFHFGSTRSGLVNSPYPSHGTRTGFYTDDFYDQPFKSPEEIRIANLCGADLRGARITSVDFYLVDLRDAILDPTQADHVRRCGAIMATRV